MDRLPCFLSLHSFYSKVDIPNHRMYIAWKLAYLELSWH